MSWAFQYKPEIRDEKLPLDRSVCEPILCFYIRWMKKVLCFFIILMDSCWNYTLWSLISGKKKKNYWENLEIKGIGGTEDSDKYRSSFIGRCEP